MATARPPVRHLALENRLERAGIDRTGESKILRALVSPGTRFLVRQVTTHFREGGPSVRTDGGHGCLPTRPCLLPHLRQRGPSTHPNRQSERPPSHMPVPAPASPRNHSTSRRLQTLPAVTRARRRLVPGNPRHSRPQTGRPERRARQNRSLHRRRAAWSSGRLCCARCSGEEPLNRLTGARGRAAANQAMSLLRSIYRRPCFDHESLRNPADLWLAGGGRDTC